MKTLITIIALSTTMITTQVMAEHPILAPNTAADLNKIFESSQLENIQALELSKKEMNETIGSFLPFVAGAFMGGAIGAWSNHGISYYQTGNWASTQNTLIATGAGALGGGYTNLMLRGAGISTSAFAPTAWQGTNGVANALIRTNGAGLGFSYAGVYKTPNVSINNIRVTPSQVNHPTLRVR